MKIHSHKNLIIKKFYEKYFYEKLIENNSKQGVENIMTNYYHKSGLEI